MLNRSRRLLSILAGLAALAALACAPSPASAGSYDVWSCRGPADQPLGMSAWNPLYNGETIIGDFWVNQNCASGGAFEMNTNIWDTGVRRPTFNMAFDLPAGATISGYRLFRGIVTAPPDGPIYDYAAATREGLYPPYADSGCKSSGVAPPFACQNQGSIDPLNWDDPANEVNRTSLALGGLSIWVGCVGDFGCNPAGALSTTAVYALHQSRVTIDDPGDPVVSGVTGTLAAGDPVWGKADLTVEATDSISGIKSIELEIDGNPAQTITIGAGTCALPYSTTRPCPGSVGKSFTLDASAMAEGTHVATGTVTDASGNQASFGPVGFTVTDPGTDPGPPPPDNGVPAVTQPTIALGSGTVTHKPGSAAAIEGTLTTSTGVSVAGAVLKARSTQLAVASPVPAALPDVTTGPDGRFSVPVPGDGARQVEISFAPSSGEAPTAVSLVRVNSTLTISLKATPKKIRIKKAARFTGRLTGVGPSAAGVPVEIQAKVGGRWESVATAAAKANGTFAWKYRFRFVKRNALFSFRAVVRAVPGWPWPTVRSGTAKVRITMGRR